MNKTKPPISDKEPFRAEVKGKIVHMSEEEKNEASQNICRELIGIPGIQNTAQIYVYQSLSDEICLDALIEWAVSKKKQIFVPYPAQQKGGFGGEKCLEGHFDVSEFEPISVGAGGKEIGGGNKIIASFCPLNAFGTFGDKSTKNDSEMASSPGIIIVPGRVFTLSGKRIGRGGGWYDKFLKEHPNFYTIGVCFDCQIFPELPQDEWDISMDEVISG